MVASSENPTTCNGSFPLVKRPRWYRVYVNNFDNENFLWSVDEGTQETERHCFKVIWAPDQPSSTHTDLTAHPKEQPRAWIAVYGVLREAKDNKGRVVLLIMRK